MSAGKLQFPLFAVCFCIAVPLRVQAQVSTGTIVGIIEDASGAVVPGAAVVITQAATGEARTTRSNASGEFSVPFLPPGGYSVSAGAGGFKTKSLSDITLRIDQTLNLRITL